MHTNPMQYFSGADTAWADCLSAWRQRWPRLGVLALLPEADRVQISALQSLCRAQDIDLIGAVFPALLTAQGWTTQGLWLLRLDERPPASLIESLDLDATRAAAQIAAPLLPILDACDEAPTAPPTLWLLCDALLPHIASVLDALYLVLSDRVVYAGANAGSETFQPLACLFDAERCVQGGVWCWLSHAPTPALAHGYQAPERLMTATSTVGNCILHIDWQPAFEVYRALILAQYGIEVTPQNFYQYAVHFPFGILRACEEVAVRIPVALTEEGALFCVGEVPANAMLVLLNQSSQADAVCMQTLATATQPPSEPFNLLSFYCAGRRLHKGAAALDELAILQSASGAAQLGGALSLGEIGNTQAGGYPLFHNAALVCQTWTAQ